MGFDKSWNTEVYNKNSQVNKYPFDHVVSTVFSYFGSVENRSNIKILELGCGTANNISFLAHEGFTATGLDGSESAIEIGKDILKAKNLKANLICQDFTNLSNFDNQSFNMVIDRGSITHNKREDIKKAISHVYRVLKSGGIFLSHIFSTDHNALHYGKDTGDGTVSEFTGGFYLGHPMIFFFASEKDIVDLYESKFTMVSKILNVQYEKMKDNDQRAMWNLICKKT